MPPSPTGRSAISGLESRSRAVNINTPPLAPVQTSVRRSPNGLSQPPRLPAAAETRARRVVLLLLFSFASFRNFPGTGRSGSRHPSGGRTADRDLRRPHGGNREIPGSYPRTGEGQVAAPGKFVTARDGGTEELAPARSRGPGSPLLEEAVPRRLPCPSPVRRPQPSGRCRLRGPRGGTGVSTVPRHAGGLLPDGPQGVRTRPAAGPAWPGFEGQHGLPRHPERQDGRSPRERFGEPAHSGPHSLTGLLKERDWTMHPDPFDGREQGASPAAISSRRTAASRTDSMRFNSSSGTTIASRTLGRRRPASWRKRSSTSAADTSTWLRTTTRARKRTVSASACSAAREPVHRGPRCSPPRAREPRLKVFDLTVDDIRKETGTRAGS